MHSRVVAPAPARALSQALSTAALSSVPGGTVAGADGAEVDDTWGPEPDGWDDEPLRFFCFGAPAFACDADALSSALRLPFDTDPPPEAGGGTGLLALLPASGLVARLPAFLPAAPGAEPETAPPLVGGGRGGEVARFATTEWPPMPGEVGGGELGA